MVKILFVCYGTISIGLRMPWKTTINHDPNNDYYQFTTFSSFDMMRITQYAVPNGRLFSCLELLFVCLPFWTKRVFVIYEHAFQ